MVKKTQKAGSGKGSAITDSRFANFQTDERFRLPSRKLGKTKVDSRFSKVLKDDEFTAAATVDRYGRKLKADSKKEALKKLYEASDDEDDDEDDIKNVEVDDDEVVEKELKKASKNYDPARGGGFSSSESEFDSESDEEEEETAGEAATKASSSMQRLRDEEAEVETGEVTSRLAVVNMDWDHVKSQDLMALFSSFVPKGGKIERISVYPSEFGKGRIEREELEGPPKEIFKKKVDSEDEESEDEPEDGDSDEDEDEKIKQDLLKEEDADDFNSDALRKYQLDRLRYYYAVVDCNNEACAESIYQATDGTEYQTTSNFLDLRFIPDGVTFDDEPRDSCTEVPASYRPTEYVTDALQHSKVKLTWDMHPEEASRKEDIKRAFTGSRSDIQENDLRAYLASDSEDSDAGADGLEADDGAHADEPKLSKKELARQRMREALGLGAEASTKSSKKEPTGEMEMTFTTGDLDGNETKTDAPEDETTVERYMRKERERKAAKKDKSLSKREGAKPAKASKEDSTEQDGDVGFDDPFFTTEGPVKVSKTSQKKEERLKKRAQKEAEATEDAAEKARLQKLMADDSAGAAEHLDHFDMNEIARAEKQKDKKNKKKQKKDGAEDRGGLQQDFEMDVTDERFKKVFENHEFAIDPSDPKFQATPGMKKLLQERRKRTTGEEGGSERSNKKARRN
ncbi:hypothetical protein PG994_000210 [Apiospora phragmitis]|uniref:NUC153 domain-containing protein n=1 Tax=Apiospora phragmitis TaxID=2905665 RepID=A0ABR1X5J3_9PEZI